jgi:hypothetical protein
VVFNPQIQAYLKLAVFLGVPIYWSAHNRTSKRAIEFDVWLARCFLNRLEFACVKEVGVMKDMLNQIHNTPTIDSVTREIEAFEARYGIETEELVLHDGRIDRVDSEDAIDWLFLYEQLRVLRELAVESLYSGSRHTVPLQNTYCEPEKLAA